jgi:hypothetical protein
MARDLRRAEIEGQLAHPGGVSEPMSKNSSMAIRNEIERGLAGNLFAIHREHASGDIFCFIGRDHLLAGAGIASKQLG